MPNSVTDKDSGASTVVAALIANVLGLIIFYFLVTVLLDSVHSLDCKNDVNSLCDAYLERMMAEGCLTDTEEAELTRQLTALGAENPDYTGTTRSLAEYGEEVTLSVTCTLPVKSHTVSGMLLPITKEQTASYTYQRYATSYH